MKAKLLNTTLETLDILGLETSPKQTKNLEKEIGVLVDAYESEYQSIMESRENARKAREEAVKLAASELIGAGVLPFLARQKASQEKIEYEKAKKFSKEAQKCEFLIRFWGESTDFGSVTKLLQSDTEGKFDLTIKLIVALYNATKDGD